MYNSNICNEKKPPLCHGELSRTIHRRRHPFDYAQSDRGGFFALNQLQNNLITQ